jgi:hypothetical protein
MSSDAEPRRSGKEEAEEEEEGPPSKCSWEGSWVIGHKFLRLQQSRRIPSMKVVICRASDDELVPKVEPGEHVVFYEPFRRGFGLPASYFTHAFSEFFEMQPHHLGANAILTLLAFATFCEAYLGIWSSVPLLCRLFYFKA